MNFQPQSNHGVSVSLQILVSFLWVESLDALSSFLDEWGLECGYELELELENTPEERWDTYIESRDILVVSLDSVRIGILKELELESTESDSDSSTLITCKESRMYRQGWDRKSEEKKKDDVDSLVSNKDFSYQIILNTQRKMENSPMIVLSIFPHYFHIFYFQYLSFIFLSFVFIPTQL